MEENKKELSQEEIDNLKKQQREYYETVIPDLKVRLEYLKLLAEISKAQFEAIEYDIKRVNILSEINNNNNGPDTKAREQTETFDQA